MSRPHHGDIPQCEIADVLGHQPRPVHRAAGQEHILDQDVARVAHVKRRPRPFCPEVRAGDISDCEAVVAKVPVGRADGRHTVADLHTVDQNVPIDHSRPAVVLNVDTVEAGLRIDVPDRDVLAAVRNLHRTTELGPVTAYVLHDQMPDEQALVTLAANRDYVPDSAASGEVAHHAVLNVAEALHRSDHHAVLGAVVRPPVLNDKPAAAHDDQGRAVCLLDAVAVPDQHEVTDMHVLGEHLQDGHLSQPGAQPHVEPDQRQRLVHADRLGDFDLFGTISHKNGVRRGGPDSAGKVVGIDGDHPGRMRRRLGTHQRGREQRYEQCNADHGRT